MHQTDVVRGAGVSKGVVYDLYHEKTRMIAFDTLERLCRFFNCQPGDLLVYVPDEEDKGKEAQR